MSFEEKSKQILNENEFSEEGFYQGNKVKYVDTKPVIQSTEKIAEAIEKCIENCDYPDEIKDNPVAIDDVIVKKQEENRKAGFSHILNGYGIKKVLSYLIGFIWKKNVKNN